MPGNPVADGLASTILVGGEGDQSNHPAWAKEGSFMVFRTYEQRTPEFVA
jgi:deferrochelatase/peroxidase EfeB